MWQWLVWPQVKIWHVYSQFLLAINQDSTVNVYSCSRCKLRSMCDYIVTLNGCLTTVDIPKQA